MIMIIFHWGTHATMVNLNIMQYRKYQVYVVEPSQSEYDRWMNIYLKRSLSSQALKHYSSYTPQVSLGIIVLRHDDLRSLFRKKREIIFKCPVLWRTIKKSYYFRNLSHILITNCAYHVHWGATECSCHHVVLKIPGKTKVSCKEKVKEGRKAGGKRWEKAREDELQIQIKKRKRTSQRITTLRKTHSAAELSNLLNLHIRIIKQQW